MKKSLFIIGSVEISLGVFVLCITSILKELMPVIGYAAYQGAAAGSYNPGNYALSFGLPNFLAIVLIVAGAVQILFSFRKEKEQ